MKFIKLIIIILAIALLLTACKKDEEPEIPPEEPPLITVDPETPIEIEMFTFTHENFPRIDGSPATAPLAQAISTVMLGQARETFEESTIFTRTSQSFRNLAAGLCDILIVAEPTPGTLEELMELGVHIDIAPIAMDALVFIVNASNPVSDLTTEQVKGIYTGEITNWQQVGGDDTEITAFQRNEEAGSQVLVEKLVMDWQSMADAPIQSFQTAFGTDELITAIMGFDGSPDAIGYTMFHYAEKMKMADGLKILSVNGVKPGTDTIASGEYPLLNPYYAVISADQLEENPARIMFNWLLSDEGQALIDLEGYVSIKSSTSSESIYIQSPELRWNVKTDMEYLTPYTTPRSTSSRLLNMSLPELVPSRNYGMLLPYSSAVTMNDGSLRVIKYGFVTQDGVVVTDPVYDNIVRAEYITATAKEPRPAYHIHVNMAEFDPNYGIQTVQAASALDGSWITPVSYVNIVFTNDVIFLMSDHETFDIDVYDYSGQKLYNIQELEWASEISEDTWSEVLVYSVSEGYGFVSLKDGTYGVMDVLTGNIRTADFSRALSFSEGLAAVIPDGQQLWGFAGRELDLVLPPAYVREAAFRNDRAIVERPDGSQHVINKQGEVLFSVTQDFFIVHNHDAIGFMVYLRSQWDYPKLYTSSFAEIEYPSGARLIGPESEIRYLSDGWYTLVAEDGVWLFNGQEEHRLPRNRYINEFVDGYIIYNDLNDFFEIVSFGVMTPDGREIVPPEEVASITPVADSGIVKGFIINSNALQGNYIRAVYTTAIYIHVDLSGNTIKTGPGILSYSEALGLFYVQGTDYFAWLDATGKIILSIPSMAYSFD